MRQIEATVCLPCDNPHDFDDDSATMRVMMMMMMMRMMMMMMMMTMTMRIRTIIIRTTVRRAIFSIFSETNGNASLNFLKP